MMKKKSRKLKICTVCCKLQYHEWARALKCIDCIKIK